MVEHLAVAVVDVGPALRLRQGARQVGEGLGAGPLEDVGEDVRRLAELEVVDVTGDDELGLGVGGQQVVGQAANLSCLGVAGVFARADRLLPAAEERVVAPLRAEVDGGDEDPLAAEAVLTDERLARVGEGLRSGRDPAGRLGEVGALPVLDDRGRPVGRAAAALDEVDVAIRAVEQHVADVAARLTTVGLVLRVDPVGLVAGAALRLDGGDEPVGRRRGVDGAVVGRAAVVLDLLDGDDVGAAQVGDDLAGEPVELALLIARRQVFDVEGGHGQLARVLPSRHLALEPAVLDGRDLRREQLEVGEGVVERPGDEPRQPVADVGVGERAARQEHVVDEDSHRIGLVVAAVDDTTGGRPGRLDAGPGDDGDLVAGRADDLGVAHADPHALHRLVEVDGVPVGAEGRVGVLDALGVLGVDRLLGSGAVLTEDDRLGHGAGAGPGDHGGDDLGRREVVPPAGAARAELVDDPVDAHGVTDGDGRRRARVDEDRLGGRVVVVRRRALQPEAGGRDGRDDALDVVDLGPVEGGEVVAPLDLGDGLGLVDGRLLAVVGGADDRGGRRVLRGRGAHREVRGVVVGVDAHVRASHRGGVVGGVGGAPFGRRGGAPAEPVGDLTIGAHDLDAGTGRGHRDPARRVGRRQRGQGGVGAVGLLDEVAPAGDDRARQGSRLRRGAARRVVAQGPAGEVDVLLRAVGELDEVAAVDGAGVAAASVGLGDDEVGRCGGGARGRDGEAGDGERCGGQCREGAAATRGHGWLLGGTGVAPSNLGRLGTARSASR